MERLRDEISQVDAVAAEAAKLARSVSVPEPPVGLQQRIRVRLMNRKPRKMAWRVQPAVVLVILVSLIAASAAAIRIWQQHQASLNGAASKIPERTMAHPMMPAVAPAPTVPLENLPQGPNLLEPLPETERVKGLVHAVAHHAHQQRRVEIPRETVMPEPKEEAPPPKREARTALPPTEQIPLQVANELPKPTSPSEAPDPPSLNRVLSADPEAILVLNATRALHHDHDPKRALKLLAEYQRRFPSGDLFEESLALAIEAKSTRNDSNAASLANEYLTRFPTGRFRDEALRAQQRFAK